MKWLLIFYIAFGDIDLELMRFETKDKCKLAIESIKQKVKTGNGYCVDLSIEKTKKTNEKSKK